MQQQQQPGAAPPQQFSLAPPPPPIEAAPFSSASPISSRPPPPQPMAPRFVDDLPGGSSGGTTGGGGLPDHDALAAAAAGEEAERAAGGSGTPGNRWPRQETLALLKIRSDMDATFRDATLKGPLWEEVSRKLAELGYRRSAKKCKEKFENVHKYYKRTKENRAGRGDGKNYRFFSQLEALSAAAGGAGPGIGIGIGLPSPSPSPHTPPALPAFMNTASAQPMTPVSAPRPVTALSMPPAAHAAATPVAMPLNVSFSSGSSESDESDSDDETQDIAGGDDESRKRKRTGRSGGGGRRKMTHFFQGLMKQVMDRQEAMQQRFLEAIEKREQDRMIREEAWRRQEMARLAREQEILAHERAMAASRDAAVVGFIQKITGQTIQMPPMASPLSTVLHTPAASQTPPTPPPPPSQPTPASQPPPIQPQAIKPLQQQHPKPPAPQSTPPPASAQQHHGMELALLPGEQQDPNSGGFEGGPASSRWPKAEVHALIQLRTNMDSRYQEAGPKGPLWEEISAGMRRLGYSRSSKRCKEKWENINKYFKKVKDSNKKRPEDSKTCPYFHQLDALYRNKQLTAAAPAGTLALMPPPPVAGLHQPQPPDTGGINLERQVVVDSTPAPPQHHAQVDAGSKNGPAIGGGHGSYGGVEVPTSNGQATAAARYTQEIGAGIALNKPAEGVDMNEVVAGQRQQASAAMAEYEKMDEGTDSDDLGVDEEDDFDDDDDEEDDEGKMQYEIQFQRQNAVHRPSPSPVGSNVATSTAPPASAAPTTTAGSFLAMVHQ